MLLFLLVALLLQEGQAGQLSPEDDAQLARALERQDIDRRIKSVIDDVRMGRMTPAQAAESFTHWRQWDIAVNEGVIKQIQSNLRSLGNGPLIEDRLFANVKQITPYLPTEAELELYQKRDLDAAMRSGDPRAMEQQIRDVDPVTRDVVLKQDSALVRTDRVRGAEWNNEASALSRRLQTAVNAGDAKAIQAIGAETKAALASIDQWRASPVGTSCFGAACSNALVNRELEALPRNHGNVEHQAAIERGRHASAVDRAEDELKKIANYLTRNAEHVQALARVPQDLPAAQANDLKEAKKWRIRKWWEGLTGRESWADTVADVNAREATASKALKDGVSSLPVCTITRRLLGVTIPGVCGPPAPTRVQQATERVRTSLQGVRQQYAAGRWKMADAPAATGLAQTSARRLGQFAASLPGRVVIGTVRAPLTVLNAVNTVAAAPFKYIANQKHVKALYNGAMNSEAMRAVSRQTSSAVAALDRSAAGRVVTNTGRGVRATTRVLGPVGTVMAVMSVRDRVKESQLLRDKLDHKQFDAELYLKNQLRYLPTDLLLGHGSTHAMVSAVRDETRNCDAKSDGSFLSGLACNHAVSAVVTGARGAKNLGIHVKNKLSEATAACSKDGIGTCTVNGLAAAGRSVAKWTKDTKDIGKRALSDTWDCITSPSACLDRHRKRSEVVDAAIKGGALEKYQKQRDEKRRALDTAPSVF